MTHATHPTSSCLKNPTPSLIPATLTVVTCLPLLKVCTVRVSNDCTVPTPGVCPEEPIFGVAVRRIEEIDEVTQLVTSPSSSDHISALGAHA